MIKKICESHFKFIFVVILLISPSLQASDIAKEKRWAEQVVDAIMDGEAVWLNSEGNKFLGIYTKSEEDKAKVVIVMHGTGAHPDWPQVVQPLRVGLIEYGWSTLSIQMPVLANEAEHEEYAPLYDEIAPRIDAAINYLKKAGVKDIALIGHSQGASMAAYYLSTSKQTVKGFVAIGLSGMAKDMRMNGIRSIEKIRVPMLDLYGKEDLAGVRGSVKQRATAGKVAANTRYSQLEIDGNHFYDGHDEALITAVAIWLNKLDSQ